MRQVDACYEDLSSGNYFGLQTTEARQQDTSSTVPDCDVPIEITVVFFVVGKNLVTGIIKDFVFVSKNVETSLFS